MFFFQKINCIGSFHCIRPAKTKWSVFIWKCWANRVRRKTRILHAKIRATLLLQKNKNKTTDDVWSPKHRCYKSGLNAGCFQVCNLPSGFSGVDSLKNVGQMQELHTRLSLHSLWVETVQGRERCCGQEEERCWCCSLHLAENPAQAPGALLSQHDCALCWIIRELWF